MVHVEGVRRDAAMLWIIAPCWRYGKESVVSKSHRRTNLVCGIVICERDPKTTKYICALDPKTPKSDVKIGGARARKRFPASLDATHGDVLSVLREAPSAAIEAREVALEP
jgi:hypothetical protein